MARVEITQDVLSVRPDGSLRAADGAFVLINERDGPAATVYEAATGSTEKDNPLIVELGRVEGWLELGRYDLHISGNGIEPYTERFEAVIGGGGGVPPTPVTDTLDADWSNDSGAAPAGHAVFGGFVHLRGRVTRSGDPGAGPDVIFTLPADSRPAYDLGPVEVSASDGTYLAHAWLEIVASTGVVRWIGGQWREVSLDGLSFLGGGAV